jgi:hypothetical protein
MEVNWSRLTKLKRSVVSHITDIRQSGVPHPNNFIQFFASNEYKDLVFNKYQVANSFKMMN